MSYKIVIPSYHRHNVIQTNTLAYLHNNNIDPINIWIFIVEEDLILYNEIPKHLYNQLIVGVKGLVHQREFIDTYFEPGTHIVSFDDDIKDLLFTVESYDTLDMFFKFCFEICSKEQAFIFGLYPVGNPFFAQKNCLYSTHLTYICGAVFGYINRTPPLVPIITMATGDGNKEDVERSILYFLQDGKVIRFNTVCIKTKYYGMVGGLGTLQDRILPMKLNSELLHEQYPTITKIKIRKNGLYELVLNDHSGCVLKKTKEYLVPDNNGVL